MKSAGFSSHQQITYFWFLLECKTSSFLELLKINKEIVLHLSEKFSQFTLNIRLSISLMSNTISSDRKEGLRTSL